MVVVVAHIEGLEPGRTQAYLTPNFSQIASFPQLLDNDTRSPYALLETSHSTSYTYCREIVIILAIQTPTQGNEGA